MKKRCIAICPAVTSEPVEAFGITPATEDCLARVQVFMLDQLNQKMRALLVRHPDCKTVIPTGHIRNGGDAGNGKSWWFFGSSDSRRAVLVRQDTFKGFLTGLIKPLEEQYGCGLITPVHHVAQGSENHDGLTYD